MKLLLVHLYVYMKLLKSSKKRFYLTVSPAAHKGYGSIAHPWPLRAKGLIVLVSPNKSDRKSNNKVSKWKLNKDYFIWA